MFVLKLSGVQTILDTFYKIWVIFKNHPGSKILCYYQGRKVIINDLGTLSIVRNPPAN